MAGFMETISSFSTGMIISKHMDSLWDHFSLPVKVAYIAFAVAYSLWGQFYDFRAKHWTLNRSDYVVAGRKEVIGAVTSGPGERANRVEFFTALAGYLANKTESLAFLDVATCGENEDEGMPSWVPNWTREASKPAYDFARSIKKDQPPNVFTFTDGGKTLQLAGLSKGRVNIMRSADLDLLQSSPWQGTFEKVLALPSKGKHWVAPALKAIGDIMYQKSFSMLTEAEKRSISLAVSLIKACLDSGLSILRAGLIMAGDTTMIYSYDVTTGGMGFLSAGEVVKGDRLVYVPDCFYHLVSRSRERTTENSIRWKLVGLVAMPTPTTQGSYSKSEWAQLRKDGAVHKYSIE
jgi:hypothetical protein